MSLSVSQNVPVENYSVIQQSENGTQFGPLNKIRFRIGSHLAYVDFHTSYMMFDLEVQNAKAKMEFTNGMGADVLLRTWRVIIGGHVVEEIDHPNVLLKTLKYDYGMDLGMEELNQIFNKQGDGHGYQGLNKITPVDIDTDNPCAKVKCVLDLKFSGIFGSTQTFPVGLTGDVEIELVLEEARKCLQVVQAGITPRTLTTTNFAMNGPPITALAGGGGATTAVNFVAGNQPFAPTKVSVQNHLGDCPFSIGQKLAIKGELANNAQIPDNTEGTDNITAIALDGADVELTHTFADTTQGTLANNCAIGFSRHGVKGDGGGLTWDNNGTLTYEVSVPSLVLQVVAPPLQYVEEQARKVSAEGLSIDIPTYTCYKTNTYAGITSATLEIPCYASRARSIMCIGVDGTQPLGGNNLCNNPYKMVGDYNDLHTYIFQIGEEMKPVRPVICDNLSTFQHNVAQEQLTELEKGLRAGGCNVKSLRNHRKNFVISRALSAYGGTIPLTMKGARVYLDYLSQEMRTDAAPTIKNKNWFNYCHHIRRLMITSGGVQVMY